MKGEIKKIIEKAIANLFKFEKADPKAQQAGYGVNFTVDYPAVEKFGDYSTNVAMVLAKILKKNPMEIAEQIKSVIPSTRCTSINSVEESNQKNKLDPSASLRFAQDDTEVFSKVEVIAPGYINFYLSEKYLQDKVSEINKEKEKFGKQENKAITVNNEFISANPTGPLHLGNGRGGFYGDVISNVLKKAGYQVKKEYFVNDAGEQVIKLGHSVLKDDEAVYTGDYIDNLNKRLLEIKEKIKSEKVEDIGWKASELIMKELIEKTIELRMNIKEMNYVFERDLYHPKAEEKSDVDRAIEILKNKNLTYEQEGALWLKTTFFGDDKDRVLIKTDGQKTYFASDCGYILNKIERKFNKIIEIWGADHHGYINRFEAATKALEFSGELKFIIVQLVRLVKDGKEVRMSKRAGNVVYIDELIDKVGHDVARFFFLMYSPDTHMNFDLGLAEERSQKNPVFYVQYAHARICSILRKAQDMNYELGIMNYELLVHPKELSLIKELNKFPELVEEIAENYEVHGLPHYAIKLADKFHSFYNDCRVIDEENSELTKARLNLINAVRIVLAETLKLIGVKAPDRM